jgi:hypothetical protein
MTLGGRPPGIAAAEEDLIPTAPVGAIILFLLLLWSGGRLFRRQKGGCSISEKQ